MLLVTCVSHMLHHTCHRIGIVALQNHSSTRKVANMNTDRWAHVLACWQPGGVRKQSRPKLRWDDCINAIFAGTEGYVSRDWLVFALDTETWEEAGARYYEI